MSSKKFFDKWFYLHAIPFYSIAAFFVFGIIYSDGVMTYNGIQIETNEYLASFYIIAFFTFLTFLFSWGARKIFSFYSNAIFEFFGYKKSKNSEDA